MTRPNILWICTDQQRFDTLGCTGNKFVKTPHIDALAEESANLEKCFVQSPVCMPSRASFLTGRYPRTTRVRQNGQVIPADEKPISRLLADAGYQCGLVGKFHLAPADPAVNVTTEARINDGYSEFCWFGDPHDEWGLHSGYTAFLAERGRKFLTRPHPECPYVEIGMAKEDHESTWCATRAIDFLRRHAGSPSPWLYSVNMFAPHHPFNPPGEYLSRYHDRLDNIPLPDALDDDLSAKPAYQAFDSKGAYGRTMPYARHMSPRDHRMVRAAYWAMCDLVDEQVGAILSALEDSGQSENTIVIFMSDHGEMLGDHGLYLKGPYFYDPAIRIPLLIRYPGVILPKRHATLVEAVDLAPALLEACGIDAYPGMQGRSLWPLLTGKETGDYRSSVYCEYYNAMPFHTNPTAHLTALRTTDYKIVIDHSNDDGELYDLKGDPMEEQNLWRDRECLPVKAELLTQLSHRMAFTVDPLPSRLSEW